MPFKCVNDKQGRMYKETVVFHFNVLRVSERLLALVERSVANPVRITIFEVRAKCLLAKFGQ